MKKKDCHFCKGKPVKIMSNKDGYFLGETKCPVCEVTREELLKEFVELQRAGCRAGSGDDMFYEQQIIDYVKKQEPMWLDFIDFIKMKTLHKVQKR